MKILIIHDRKSVSDDIRSLLSETVSGQLSVDVAEDYRTAKAALEEVIYDLVIVDLTIPFLKSDAAPPNFKAAEHLLTELFKYDTMNVPGDVIGITRDNTALSLVENSLGRHLMLTIEEDEAGEWRSQLVAKIAYALRASETRFVSINQHYGCDLLIMTAIDKEMKPYRDTFEFEPLKHFPGAWQFGFSAGGSVRRGVAFSVGRSGQPPAASFAQALITMFRPRLAIMSGYCGAVSTSPDPEKRKVQLGDLIIFEAAYAWDYGKWMEEKDAQTGLKQSIFRSRPDPIDIRDQPIHRAAREFLLSGFEKDQAILDQAFALSKGTLATFSMHLGSVASGSAVVTNDEIVSQIRGLNEAMLGVDMESYGFYQAARSTPVVKPQFVCIKAASDFCNGEKGDDLHEACSYLSASAALKLVDDWDFDSA